MGAIQKLGLSGSSQGTPIQIVATATPGTTLHTTGTSATVIDEVWIYATNNDTVQRNIIIEYGGSGTASEISVGVPSKSGLTIVLPGTIFTGTGVAGNTIRGYASATNVINVIGYINRMTP